MKVKELVLMALLLGIGTVLHMIPGFMSGMKPDMLLTMMFLAIILFPDKKNVLVVAIATGILSALTTGFPGGQVPNIIDKLVTAFAVLGLYHGLKRFKLTAVTASVLTILGTLISGTVFLISALLIVGLPGGATFMPLFIAVVLPATAMNTVLMVILFPIVQTMMKRSNFRFGFTD